MTLHPGIDRAAYEALPGLNWSALKQGQGRTGMHIQTYLDGVERTDSASFKFGRALHQAILQPEIFATSWTIKPGVKTTTVDGMLSESEAAHITAIAAKFHALGLQIEQTELAMTWERDGYACKGSIDAITVDGHLLDLKTTDDASPKAMAASSWRFGYHSQLAYYRQGLIANGIEVKTCLIIALEKAPPYSVGVYRLGDYALQRGEKTIAFLLGLYRDRTTADYPPIELPTPTWAMTDDLVSEGT